MGAGYHFWQLVNQLAFDNTLIVESKGSKQGILDALSTLKASEDDEYYFLVVLRAVFGYTLKQSVFDAG